MKKKLAGRFAELFSTYPNNDLALEWCEETLLENTQYAHAPNFKCKPADYELFKDLTAAELKVVQPLLQSARLQRREVVLLA